MPYKKNEDLSENVIHVLPSHAQDIYRAAFKTVCQIHNQMRPAVVFKFNS